MSKIAIHTPDHQRIYQELAMEKELLEPEAERKLESIAYKLEGHMKEFTPSRLGLTRASIEVRKEGRLTFGVGSWTRGDILRFLDRGTGIYRTGRMIVITPRTRRTLRWIAQESGEVVFAAYVLQKGIVPMEIFTRAIQRIMHAFTSMEE